MPIKLGRSLKPIISDYLKPGQAVILYGARRVGKTTLIGQIRDEYEGKVEFINCDISFERARIATEDFSKLELVAKGVDLLMIDEAQKIENIGQILKILVDNFPHLRILATGSTSFDLANKMGQPLTGRKRTLTMYPFAIGELFKKGDPLINEKFEELLIYGTYPKVFNSTNAKEKQEELNELVESYLYKDILEFEGIRNSRKIQGLLILLAFQVGSKVVLRELASNLDLHSDTVSKYLDLLEKAFVIFNVRGFSRNLRKEVSKTSKYYFYDNGVRNALINNFNVLKLRDDKGKLWENLCMVERRKYLEYNRIFANHYFWRTYQQKEIDLVEEREGKLFAYEFKYGNGEIKPPKDFINNYNNSEFKVITPDNLDGFVF